MQTRITSCRSMLSSFDSSSGVRWFGMPLPPCCGLGSIRTRKNPTARGHDRARCSAHMSRGTQASRASRTIISGNFNEVRGRPQRSAVLRGALRRSEGRSAALLRRGRRCAARPRARAGRRGFQLGRGRAAPRAAVSSARARPARARRVVAAARFALRRPQDVRALVLAGSAGISTGTRRAERLLTIAAFLRPSRLYSRHRERVAHSKVLRYLVFGYWGASDPGALMPEAVEGFLAGPRLHTDSAIAARVLVKDDPRVELDLVRCSTLVLWGARDHQVPVDDAFEYARRLRAELRVVSDCGHLLIGERPEVCVEAISDFLDRVG